MTLASPKSKANSVDRPDFGTGFGEPQQAGFGHVPSGHAARSAQSENRVTARDISRAAAKDPAAMEQLRGALAQATQSSRSNIGTTIVPPGSQPARIGTEQ
jgi:excinuclease ABC subunit B